MDNWLVGKTLYERTLEGRIKVQEDAYRNLGLEMDKVCVMWDGDRAKLKKAHEERDKYKKALEEIAEQFTPRNAFTAKHDSLVDIAREALK